MLVDVKTGSGTITKLIYDDSLYTELVNTNTELQNLLIDLQQNPHRYIHMSVFGSKVRGVDLNKRDEIKLQKILDSIPE